ncbi:hypothetical protein B0T21DRAFT_201818 [Apiosordaria backusii]|uniref:Tyrosine specific protein phosphatases domain-containing protein n=1 Tax=Apiosordaria backusii TaxID=314023 RepID=A0AA40BEJ2_9PEZI|nr:hypothetical protein B0T21DRAFT_201818 [Apiosordaria backusii]
MVMAPNYDAKSTDPPLLQRFSAIKSYTTTVATYDKLRIFYRKHPQSDNLPKDPPLPLLVFIHGLGGSVAQFNRILTSLTQNASCLAVDLPGCGVSEFTQTRWEAYSTDALVELLEVIINDHREKGQRVVLIAHSMGCSLAALLANPRTTLRSDLKEHVVGLVAMCPKSKMLSEQEVKKYRLGLWVPEFLFNLWRTWDRRGGLNSASITRFVGKKADAEAKRLQLLFNHQSRTPVFRRMAWGLLPTFENGVPSGGLPEIGVWAGIRIPILLISGGLDKVTPESEARKLYNLLRESQSSPAFQDAEHTPNIESPVSSLSLDPPPAADGADQSSSPAESPASSPRIEPAHHAIMPQNEVEIPPFPLKPMGYVSWHKIKWAGHGLLFTDPIVPGLISDFLSEHVTRRLELGWQLQYLTRDGKWDVKNLEKWQSVTPVSESIGGVFRAIKTLRQVDDTHCPVQFNVKYGDFIKDVIDISHDTPVYDPQNLRDGGITYHKVATVSKIPPPREDINRFIETVDKIRQGRKEQPGSEKFEIGVHCHYGFNRTGFLIVCYLVEKCGFTVDEAIKHFAEARPNGIKHAHFKDRLHVMYAQRNVGN